MSHSILGNFPHRVTDNHPAEADAWMQVAELRPGSRWPDYRDWLTERADELGPAPKMLGSRQHKATAKDPRHYVYAR